MKPLFVCLLVVTLAGCTSYGMEQPLHLMGSPSPTGSGYHTILITPDTKHVNVVGGEVINFRVGDKAFTWNFYIGTGTRSFDLRRAALEILDHSVIAYVSTDPRYQILRL